MQVNYTMQFDVKWAPALKDADAHRSVKACKEYHQRLRNVDSSNSKIKIVDDDKVKESKNVKQETTSLTCTKCTMVFVDFQLWKIHIALHENKAKLNYICKLCNKGFISPSKLKVHQVAHQTTKNFVCNKRGCGKKYKHRSDLVRHVRLYHNKNVKWLKCNLCKYVTRVKSSLKTHMKSHNGGRLPSEK